MIISIDTEIISSMATMAQKACDELETCVSMLVSLEEHDDWNCKERDSINDNITIVKHGNRKLQEVLEVFANAMRNVSQEFLDFEKKNAKEYQQVEVSYGTAFSIPCKQVDSNMHEETTMHEIATNISKNMYVSGRVENFSLGNLEESLKVCNFSDVDFGNMS